MLHMIVTNKKYPLYGKNRDGTPITFSSFSFAHLHRNRVGVKTNFPKVKMVTTEAITFNHGCSLLQPIDVDMYPSMLITNEEDELHSDNRWMSFGCMSIRFSKKAKYDWAVSIV